MKENPDYPKWKLFLDLGKRNLELEENESAKNALSKSILIRQDKYSSFFYRGLANHRLNNFSEAVNDFTKSLEIKDNFKSYIGRGRAFNKLFDYESALKDIILRTNFLSQIIKLKMVANYFLIEVLLTII